MGHRGYRLEFLGRLQPLPGLALGSQKHSLAGLGGAILRGVHLAHLRLRDFRNYQRLDADFGPGFHLLLGDNAQGKTNILEAIYLIATLRSFRGVGGAQMIRHGQEGRFIGGTPRSGLLGKALDAYVSHMKTVTSREFFHWPSTVKALHPGQSLAVTDNGVPSFIVTKAGKQPRRARADLEREAREICPQPRKHKINFTQAIRDLKGR